MRYTRLGQEFLLRLETGDEIVGTVTEFAAAQELHAAAVEGIGSVYDAVLGYFDRSSRTYLRHSVKEDTEIVSLLGNVALKDGKPLPHLHVVLGSREFAAIAGHLFEGRAAATVELVIRPLAGSARRTKDETTGLFLLDL
ncbi:MAG TPA: DUF296 domain-containing protein [Vicinamibacterales bacterium]|nr:DUF296 domain-containing protein [Vicinamibacterales bacterium]